MEIRNRRHVGSFLGFHLNGSKRILIFGHIILECHQKPFGMLRGDDGPRSHRCFLEAWQHGSEVNDELRAGMCDEREIDINALRHVGCHLYLQLFSLRFLIIHILIC